MGRTNEKIRAANVVGKRLCIGFDPNKSNIAKAWGMSGLGGSEDAHLYNWACDIIEAAGELPAAYKANYAFWWEYPSVLRRIFRQLRETNPDVVLIVDAKLGDIDSTGAAWAQMPLYVGADAATINPYMGVTDVTKPFTSSGIDCFVLVKTSNQGANQLQGLYVTAGLGHTIPLFQAVAGFVRDANENGFGMVVGATDTAALKIVAEEAPNAPFLVPGYGKQGGQLSTLMETLLAHPGGSLVNSSRGIAEPDCEPGDKNRWQEAVAKAVVNAASELRG